MTSNKLIITCACDWIVIDSLNQMQQTFIYAHQGEQTTVSIHYTIAPRLPANLPDIVIHADQVMHTVPCGLP